MTAIICHRLFTNSKIQPEHKVGTTYEWKDGTFNCRNIADRDYLWTNIRRSVADELHASTTPFRPVAYLLACSDPEDTTLQVWAIPEPLLYSALSRLTPKEGGAEYYIQIWPSRQRIENDPASPDLAEFHREFSLSKLEYRALQESREVDVSVKMKRALSTVERRVTESGFFDPHGITDARKRVLSSIVRRRGQPAFRKQLLRAYGGRCAISGCDLEAVLDAAHIFPYMGPDTNHPGNGLLLRTDLHTLFDLKLIAVETASMTLLLSPLLTGTCYDEFRARPLTLPDNPEWYPSREALQRHRLESGL
jgi:hypothetical protein